MIRIDCQQGTPEWYAARLGIPTSSNFSSILTEGGKLSRSCDKYAWALLAEQILQTPTDDASSGFMARGSSLEFKARAFYEMERDADVEQIGFVLRDDRRAGCSPDGLVGDDGLLEIKCPSAANHIGYLLDDQGIGYKAQVQGQLWVCERAWCDTLSFHPDMPPALVRIARDEAHIALLDKAIAQFCEYLDEQKRVLIKKGVLPEQEFPALRVA